MEPADARRVQQELASLVIRHDTFLSVRSVCGLDVGFKSGMAVAACVVMSFPGLELLESRACTSKIGFPYVPGLLSFREIPALILVLQALKLEPDLIIADGQGIAHPLRFGLASHLGVLLDKPVIGCAKSRLVGKYGEPGPEKGDWEYLREGDEILGAVVRTRARVKPLFVSIGHRISLHSARCYVLECCRGFRITEPVRAAHHLASLGTGQRHSRHDVCGSEGQQQDEKHDTHR
jgi:deoxyribonuclease V